MSEAISATLRDRPALYDQAKVLNMLSKQRDPLTLLTEAVVAVVDAKGTRSFSGRVRDLWLKVKDEVRRMQDEEKEAATQVGEQPDRESIRWMGGGSGAVSEFEIALLKVELRLLGRGYHLKVFRDSSTVEVEYRPAQAVPSEPVSPRE